MAQLNDTMVQGDLRVTGRIFGAANSLYDEKDVEASPNHRKITADIDTFFLSQGYQQSLSDTLIQPGTIRLRGNSTQFTTTTINAASASFGGSLSVSDNTTMQGNLLLQPASNSTYLSISVKKQDNSQYITNEMTSSGPKFTLYANSTSYTSYTTITATSSGPTMKLSNGTAYTEISGTYIYGQNGQTSYELTNSYLAFNTEPSNNPYIKLGSECFIVSNTLTGGANEIQFANKSDGAGKIEIPVRASQFIGELAPKLATYDAGTYNFDNFTTPGTYYINASSSSTNRPNTGKQILQVFSFNQGSSSVIYQVSLGYYIAARRNYNSGGWNDWVQIATIPSPS